MTCWCTVPPGDPKDALELKIFEAIDNPGRVTPRQKVTDDGRYEDTASWCVRAVLSVVEPFLATQRRQVEKYDQSLRRVHAALNPLVGLADGPGRRAELAAEEITQRRVQVERLRERSDGWQADANQYAAERDAANEEIRRLRDNPVARRMKAERDEARAEVARWQAAWRGADRAWAEDRDAAWRVIQAWDSLDGESTHLGTTTPLDRALHALRLQLSAEDAQDDAEIAHLRAQSDTGQDVIEAAARAMRAADKAAFDNDKQELVPWDEMEEWSQRSYLKHARAFASAGLLRSSGDTPQQPVSDAEFREHASHRRPQPDCAYCPDTPSRAGSGRLRACHE